MLRGLTIGCGFFSRIQMEAWKRVNGARIVAACDIDEEKAKAFASDFDLKAYSSLDKTLEAHSPDFFDIATRPATHLELVRELAPRKLPILLQKPIAETWDEACEIVEIAKQAGVALMVNENWRWQRWYREIADLIQAGKIGEPFYYSMQMRARDGIGENPFPNQPYFKDMPRFLITESLVHLIDTARFLFGDIEQVYARTAKLNPVMAGEDFAQIALKHLAGIHGSIDGNRTSPPDENGPALEFARFEGSEGTLRLRHTGEVMLGDECVFDGRDLPGYRGDCCRAAQQHFIDCLIENLEFETEAADYLKRTFAVVEACYLSADEDRPVCRSELSVSFLG